MECRWENFGIERRPIEVERLGLAIPDTSSFRNLVSLSECTGPRGLHRICVDSANLLNAAVTLIFDGWEFLLQPDAASRESGRRVELDLSALHRMTKAESVPDYIVRGSREIARDLISLSGELPRDLFRIAEGLELNRPEAAMEIGMNIRNLQLILEQSGGRLLFARESETLELPALG